MNIDKYQSIYYLIDELSPVYLYSSSMSSYQFLV